MRGFWRNWRSKRCLFGVALGLCVALLSLLPYFSLLEEKIGLGLLFAQRGELNPPAEVVIINIDRESANLLSIAENPEQWPRRFHAKLIRRLNELGAELIGFNIFFSTPQPADDAEMAAAMQASGSVVLANYLRLKHLQGDAYIESLEEPPESLAKAALATVPFLLVQGEETDRFLIRFGESGDHPTFPLVLLRLFVLKQHGGELESLLREGETVTADASVLPSRPLAVFAPFFADLEDLFGGQPRLRDRTLQRLHGKSLPPGQRASMLSLFETLSGETTRYFNHFGATGTIPRIPYHSLLLPQEGKATPDLHGKVALVGFDEEFHPDKSENIFYSPFSPVSSLELVATAIANLLNHNEIHPIFGRWGQFAWLFLWGSLLGWLSSKKLRVGLPSMLLLAMAYFAIACWLFREFSLWLPLILPLFWVTPLAMIGCLVDNYVMRSQENRKIHSVIDRFIPDEATNRTDNSEDEGHGESKVSFGVCLATDAGQYTSLAEKMNPMDLGELMNDYYSTLFPMVRQNGGWVSDVTGDAMMAIWTVPISQNDIRLGALRAALDILHAVDCFQDKRHVRLPIRMGLHCGEMRIGFVGGKENAAYRAVGDTVNTSARLEGLNKLLGTRILVSLPLINGLAGFITRPMGSFMLAGKTHSVDVHELIAPVDESAPWLVGMIARFDEALGLFQAGKWQAAANTFEALSRKYPEDGPTRFYARTARANAENPLATPDMAAIQVLKSAPGALALK
ncbi:MAG: adenylate/guanylate cyclase domain-containing protein [Proteobacteria bacterium]|nr:adenylate/guanylate cyclase domain-containing protein [Pseudomonadota bacterium]